LFSLVIAVTAVVLVVVVVVGRRILAPEKLGSSAATMSSMQPTSEPEGDPDKAHAAISQVPTENSESSSTNRGSGSEAGPRQRVRVPAEVAQELLTTQIMPAYPTLARQAHVQGMVVLDVDISKGGAIESLRTISGHPMLVPAAIDAVKQWRYKPYLLNGEPVSVETRVTVSFNLSNG
jgi:TonB family protein